MLFNLGMSACLESEDFITLSGDLLSESDERIKSTPSEQCVPFNLEAQRLEQHLLHTYKLVAICVKKEDDLNRIAAWWETMTTICDNFSLRLKDLHAQHPHCGAAFFYDRVLDLRNKCKRLREMHS